MIVCPNCNHQNPDGASQCESCYTPLPVTASCSNCGAAVQTDAAFCGQCGFNLRPGSIVPEVEVTVPSASPVGPTVVSPLVPDLGATEPPTIAMEPLVTPHPGPNLEKTPASIPTIPDPAPSLSVPVTTESVATAPNISPPVPDPQPAGVAKTQLQQQSARLIHVQTNTPMELPHNLAVIHIGKPNDLVPPDIDVSGFANSEIVSRVHANLRVEGDACYLEDVGSSNGTYVNNTPLPKGNRHRLRPGDRISLGKGDLVTFLFQIS
ncbi:MAG: FHA domain-containing protein [Microcoleus sp. PH2017_10_PVI_O_A]|uniref:FHA domain-containing protein n=1 Tax=unclassified Microcoleus TaxID=2642155 RepID=UPI001E105B00|nr:MULTISPECIES: FHA domain-containing protein [unclassified Microcoleus]TAE84712.1 MAG: FHA domain-containing protein [Oscillatoriales cyanobacterium]MCC3406385.1 FHA domain-containing protein [Microcoleus sp. PH2017_10_PVI_O_A]MCC3459012.1 FHA domain-containing protein [Microcoleus sp. PH2017_11_PCY_U_A]MCC3477843.1 FHA domain-containing protein [Microcoleus sp. PH2017_12_PCY_D_A]MCC3527786.1 FHA domain-containing protein [Microcoleus sp. PH2017_21_RUC_O_A]